MNPFTDRREAGRQLARQLAELANRPDVVVLAVPRGGVPVAFEVARALDVPLDVLLVNKVYAPGTADVHIGTVASGGFAVVHSATIESRGIDPTVAQREMARARRDLQHQERIYFGGRAATELYGRTVILIYDGVVTGASMRVAVAAVRARGAARVVVAAPVIAPNAIDELAAISDACIAVTMPDPFYRIGIWYADFAPVTDASVLFLLERAALTRSAAAA
jgi:predicted phosphoribosyltransferase